MTVRIRRSQSVEVGELHRRMQQMMERLLLGVESTVPEVGWVPRSDVRETPEGISVTLEIPGVEREAIEIVVESNYLRVSGVRGGPEAQGCVRWHQMEIAYGPFERVIALPFEADPERITATYRNGFLHIEVEGAPAPREIPIQTP